jgi:hypothetical protein
VRRRRGVWKQDQFLCARDLPWKVQSPADLLLSPLFCHVDTNPKDAPRVLFLWEKSNSYSPVHRPPAGHCEERSDVAIRNSRPPKGHCEERSDVAIRFSRPLHVCRPANAPAENGFPHQSADWFGMTRGGRRRTDSHDSVRTVSE